MFELLDTLDPNWRGTLALGLISTLLGAALLSAIGQLRGRLRGGFLWTLGLAVSATLRGAAFLVVVSSAPEDWGYRPSSVETWAIGIGLVFFGFGALFHGGAYALYRVAHATEEKGETPALTFRQWRWITAPDGPGPDVRVPRSQAQ